MEITSKEFYKARSQIMGIATLLILAVHLVVNYDSQLIGAIHRFGQIGVEIFLFISGIGCYQSINNRNILDFYKRRFIRVIPIYLIIFISYGIFKCCYEGMDILTYWINHSMFMFPITGETWHWFIFGILILYLLTPIFYKMIGHYSFWITFVGIIFISSQIVFSPWAIPSNISLFNELFIARIPTYMLGMYFGWKFSNNETVIINTEFYLKLIGIILLLFWDSYFNKINTMAIFHYISIIGCMYITFALVPVFNKIKVLPLEWLGKYSLESYLLNEKITLILLTYTTMNLIEVNFYGIILTFVFAIILKLFMNLIIDKKLGL